MMTTEEADASYARWREMNRRKIRRHTIQAVLGFAGALIGAAVWVYIALYPLIAAR